MYFSTKAATTLKCTGTQSCESTVVHNCIAGLCKITCSGSEACMGMKCDGSGCPGAALAAEASTDYIVCTPNRDCRYVCACVRACVRGYDVSCRLVWQSASPSDGLFVCSDTTITCDPSQDCDLHCFGNEACQQSKVVCPPNHNCHIL